MFCGKYLRFLFILPKVYMNKNHTIKYMTNRYLFLFVKHNIIIWCKVSDRTVLIEMW